MTPHELGDLLHDLPPGSERRREEARFAMSLMRADGRLLEPEPPPRISGELAPHPDLPAPGEWARPRSRDVRTGYRRAPNDHPTGAGRWHRVRRAEAAMTRSGGPIDGAWSVTWDCGRSAVLFEHAGGAYRVYVEHTAEAPADGACRRCLASLERARAERSRLAAMMRGDA